MRCTVIGLGEAGRIYAVALQNRGHEVVGYDPSPAPTPGLHRAATAADAVRDAEVVLVLTTANASRAVAESVAAHLAPAAVYADLTSSSPTAKRELGKVLPEGIRAADVAILGPVISLGSTTPLMAAGPGAPAVADLLSTVGAPIEVVPGQLGDAMGHKMVRSIFMKGLAAIVCEAVDAGRKAGFEDWVRGQIAAELSGDGQATIDRFRTGSRKHAARRAEEMAAVAEYCDDLAAPSIMSKATRDALQLLADGAA